MNQQYRKKLIEVALPLEAINKESAREKSIRHGHPSTLHLWWARRPLAACRAVLFASLVDDPDSDPTFRQPDGSVDEDRAGARRAELFNLIEELVQWENSNNESVINRARAEIAASVASRKILDAKEWTKDQIVCGEKAWAFVCRTAKPQNVNAFLVEHAPPVLDPFCGGGSIPLEAQRLGLLAYASDLNPVPVLITKALIEIPPKFLHKAPVNPEASRQGKINETWKGAQGLAEDVRYYGNWVRREAEKRIGHLYPKLKVTTEMADARPDLKPYIGERLTVVAWLWARSIVCPNPACQGQTPIAKTFQLSSKKGNEAFAVPHIDQTRRSVSFTLELGKADSPKGNVGRRGATCLLCGQPIPLNHIRQEAQLDRMGQVLLGIVVEGKRRRLYLSPTPEHVAAGTTASDAVECFTPTTELPKQALGFRVQRYGMTRHGDLFARRQLVALTTFADLVRSLATTESPIPETNDEYKRAIATYLAFAVDKAANYWSSLCSWYVAKEIMVSTFGLPTLSMVWDFAEANPFSDSSGNWLLGVEQAVSSLGKSPDDVRAGHSEQLDATRAWLDTATAPLVCTDPPYYDNIGYAALSDFFYVWLRHMLGRQYPQLFSTLLTPKEPELIAEPGRFDNDAQRAVEHFESGLATAFSRMRRDAAPGLPTTIFYAFKQQEDDADDPISGRSVVASSGWEKMLTALIEAGFCVQGTWPMRTEQTGGLREAKRNSLASSIVLTCQPRPSDASLATRREFLNALKRELPEALKHLQRGSIAPVDLAQAAIGPGMAVYTRYAKVMEADGSPMKVRQALALINQMLGEVLAEQEGEFDGDTRWALAWFEQFGMDDGAFGAAETLSKAKNTAVNGLVDAGIIAARAGKVRLLKRDELPDEWNPATDNKVRHWEIAQHLIHALETGGETAAADLLRKVGGMGEVARDLAYRLYNLCERKKWPSEALAYNSLVIAWPEISKLARSAPKQLASQGEMFAGGL